MRRAQDLHRRSCPEGLVTAKPTSAVELAPSQVTEHLRLNSLDPLCPRGYPTLPLLPGPRPREWNVPDLTTASGGANEGETDCPSLTRLWNPGTTRTDYAKVHGEMDSAPYHTTSVHSAARPQRPPCPDAPSLGPSSGGRAFERDRVFGREGARARRPG